MLNKKFTLVELLLTIVILSLLITVATINASEMKGEAVSTASEVDINSIQNAVDRYNNDVKRSDLSDGGIPFGEIDFDKLVPEYISYKPNERGNKFCVDEQGIVELREFCKEPPEPIEMFDYDVDAGGGIIIKGFSNKVAASEKPLKLVIPSAGDGKPVTKIADAAFEGEGLLSVEFPSTITHIGKNAFAKNKLTKVDLPPRLVDLGFYSFQSNEIESVVIPNRVYGIGQYSFDKNKIKHLVIPKNVTSIGYSAFSNNQIEKVTIEEGVVRVGGSAFRNNKIREVEIPNSVRFLDYAAFDRNLLTFVEIPETVTSIGEWVFYNNPDLKEAVVPQKFVDKASTFFNTNPTIR